MLIICQIIYSMARKLDPNKNYFTTEQHTYYTTKYEADKYYLLNSDKYYFLPVLQRSVKFDGTVAIQLKHFNDGKACGGYLIDLGLSYASPDYVTNIYIEFSEDSIVSEYNCKSGILFYIDFPFIKKEQVKQDK